MRLLLAPTATVLLAVLLAACASAGGPPTGIPSPSPPPSAAPTSPPTIDVGGSWRLERGTVRDVSIRIPEKHPITLEIQGMSVKGTASCNQYGGRIQVAGAGIRIGELMQTEMACEEPAMTAEGLYITGLGLVDNISRDGEALVLSGQEVELRFVPEDGA